jgi:hypothetical protein
MDDEVPKIQRRIGPRVIIRMMFMIWIDVYVWEEMRGQDGTTCTLPTSGHEIWQNTWIKGLPSRERKRRKSYHSTSESFRAFWNIVSFTAAKTNLMLVAFVVCVRLHVNGRHRHDDKEATKTYWGYTLNHWLACVKHHKMYFAALLISGPAVHSGKCFSSGTYKTTTMQKCQFGMKRRRWR